MKAFGRNASFAHRPIQILGDPYEPAITGRDANRRVGAVLRLRKLDDGVRGVPGGPPVNYTSDPDVVAYLADDYIARRSISHLHVTRC